MSAGPLCCGQPATWVNQGPRLQYYYCKECKKEVPDTTPVKKDDEDDGFYPLHMQGTGPCYVDSEKKINYHFWAIIGSTTKCNCGMIN